MIELVDFNEIYGKGKGEVKEAAKRTRRAGSGKKTLKQLKQHTDCKSFTKNVCNEEQPAAPVTEEASKTGEKA